MNEDSWNGNKPKKEDTFLQSLKCVHELPDDMQEAIGANASLLSRSFEIQTNEILDKNDHIEEGDLAPLLTPFVMELSFLKIQLAAVTSELDEIRNGKSN